MATAQQISEATGRTEAYARMIIAGSRTPSLKTALQIFDATGAQFGPLRGLDTAGIEVARHMAEAA